MKTQSVHWNLQEYNSSVWLSIIRLLHIVSRVNNLRHSEYMRRRPGSVLFYVMTWCHRDNKPLPEPMLNTFCQLQPKDKISNEEIIFFYSREKSPENSACNICSNSIHYKLLRWIVVIRIESHKDNIVILHLSHCLSCLHQQRKNMPLNVLVTRWLGS